MASFVESATLKVIDQSTGPINKINAALKSLQATAKSLNKSTRIDTGQLNKATAGLNSLKTAAKAATASANIKYNVNTAALKTAYTAVTNLNRTVGALRTASTVRIIANTSGLAQAQNQINRLRASARAPIALAIRGLNALGPVPPGAGGVLGTRGSALGGAGGFLKNTASYIAGQIGYQLIHSIGHEAKESLFQAGIAKTSMDLKPAGMTAGAQSAINAIQQSQRQSGLVWANRAETEKLYADSLSITAGGGPEEATHLIQQAQSLARLGSSVGQTREQAMEGALDFIRAAEQTGAIYSKNKMGEVKYDPKKAEDTFNTMRQLQSYIGASFTGQKWKSLMQSAGVSKYGMSSKGLMTLAFLGQEMGTRAATGIDTALKNLTGNVLTKQKKERLAQLGLLDPEMVKGKGSLKDLVTKGATDEESLRGYMLGWMHDKVFPAMEKLGLDLNKPGDAQKMASLITSGKGSPTLAALITQFGNLEKDIRFAEQIPGSKEDIDKVTKQSPKVMWEAMEGGIQDVLGQGLLQLAPVMTPAVEKVSGTMSKLADDIAAGKSGFDIGKTMMAGGGALLGVGLMNGIRAMTSTDPATRALGGAAFALDSAAGLLLAAAGALLKGTGYGEEGTTDKTPETPEQTAKRESAERELQAKTDYYDQLKKGNIPATDVPPSERNKEAAAGRPGSPEAKAVRDAYIESQKPVVFDQIRKLTTEMGKMGISVEILDRLNKKLKDEVPELPRIPVDPAARAAYRKAQGIPPREDPTTVEGWQQRAQQEYLKAQIEAKERERDQLKQVMETQPPSAKGAKSTDKIEQEKTKILEYMSQLTVEIDQLKQHQQALLKPEEKPPPPTRSLEPKPSEAKPPPAEEPKPAPIPLDLRPVKPSAFGNDVDSLLNVTMPKSLAELTRGMDAAGKTFATVAAQYMDTHPLTRQTDTDWDVKQQGEIPGAGGDLSGTVDRFSSVIGEFSAAGSSVASSIDGSSSSLITAGATAASTIAAGASSAGSAYGSAAAAKIASAVANVSITVNNTGGGGGKPDAGTKPMAA